MKKEGEISGLAVSSPRGAGPKSSGRAAAVLGLVAGLIALVWLLAGAWSRSYPPVASPLKLTVIFPAGIAGSTEPIITTGVFGDGDFLLVKYLDEKTAVFVYDVWGMGGPASAPFALQPGFRHTLEIEMPTLAPVRDMSHREKRPLRVGLDGREILQGGVFFHRRKPPEIFFGVNPIGGTFGRIFRGELAAADGRVQRGGPDSVFSRRERVRFLLLHRTWWLIGASLGAALVALVVRWMAQQSVRLRRALPDQRTFADRTAPPQVVFAVSGILCTGLFAALVTGGTFRLVFAESFGSFYDHQAASLLQGHLDVPREALDGEAFNVGGKVYGYFGITPALLRLPFALTGVAFGQLSRGAMLADYIACLVAAYALLGFAMRLLAGGNAWPSRWAVIVFIGGAGLGSTLFFLGSRAYIYHEAILCGAAFALWSTYCALRYLEAPASRWWLGAVICGAFSVHARPSSGLFALGLTGCVALTHLRHGWRAGSFAGWRRHFAVGVLSVAGVLSFNGLSYLKFGTFDGSPLRFSAQYTPERLAKFGGSNFHRSNLAHNVDTYVLQPDFHFEPSFPYIYFGARKDRFYPEAMLDLEEPTLAVPFSMPCLFALAIGGGIWAWLRVPHVRPPLLLLALGVAPMALALFTAVVTSHRYTADFCPFLIASAAFGLAVLDTESGWRGPAFLTAASALAVVSVCITLALSLHYQGATVWGVPEDVLKNYQNLRESVDALVQSLRRD